MFGVCGERETRVVQMVGYIYWISKYMLGVRTRSRSDNEMCVLDLYFPRADDIYFGSTMRRYIIISDCKRG